MSWHHNLLDYCQVHLSALQQVSLFLQLIRLFINLLFEQDEDRPDQLLIRPGESAAADVGDATGLVEFEVQPVGLIIHRHHVAMADGAQRLGA